MGYLYWLVINACVLRRQRGIPFVARHTCIWFAHQCGKPFLQLVINACVCGGSARYFSVARHTYMSFAKAAWDTLCDSL